jgi:MFS family permease
MSQRWLAPPCLVSVLWAFSFGVNAPLASLWMQRAGFSDSWIGVNTSAYYLGIALAAVSVPWGMRKLGSTALFLGLAGSAVTAAAFPWGGGLTGWFIFRALNGVAAAWSLIPIETFVNRSSSADRRALNFGYYAFCIALGMGLGNLVAVEMAESQPRLAFLLGGLAALLAAAVVPLWQPAFPADVEVHLERPPLHLGRNFLAFGSGWAQGFLEGGMVALLPIYLLSINLSPRVVGGLMGGLMVGVILAQAPLAWLADRLGRGAVLAGCNIAALLGVGCLLWPGNIVWLGFWLFVVGACSGAFYPLGLALLGERTLPGGMSRLGAAFLAINCAGSLIGPSLAGRAMDLFGRGALFVTGGGAIGLVLGGWLISLGVSRWLASTCHGRANPGRLPCSVSYAALSNVSSVTKTAPTRHQDRCVR